MLLTDAELNSLRAKIDESSGMDKELLKRCGELLHNGQYDDAVRNAFILLEERLRAAVNKDRMTGVQLAEYSFGANGPLASLLGGNGPQQKGLQELYCGAFRLFRNPAAHSMVGHDSVEGKSIIGLVNLLLRILDDLIILPEHLEKALQDTERSLGPAATIRLRKFLHRCTSLGLKTRQAQFMIPFKRPALARYPDWDKPKIYQLPVFYLMPGTNKQLWFPVNQYYKGVVGLDPNSTVEKLEAAGFQRAGKHMDYVADLESHNAEEFFAQVMEIVRQLSTELDRLLKKA